MAKKQTWLKGRTWEANRNKKASFRKLGLCFNEENRKVYKQVKCKNGCVKNSLTHN